MLLCYFEKKKNECGPLYNFGTRVSRTIPAGRHQKKQTQEKKGLDFLFFLVKKKKNHKKKRRIVNSLPEKKPKKAEESAFLSIRRENKRHWSSSVKEFSSILCKAPLFHFTIQSKKVDRVLDHPLKKRKPAHLSESLSEHVHQTAGHDGTH